MGTYYSILGLQPGASKTEIKRAYRRLAMMYHPDRNKSKSARKIFLQVDKAYDALYNGKSRSASYASKRKKNRKKTPFEKWAHVQHAPTNSKDHAEWYKVKQGQKHKDPSYRKSNQPDWLNEEIEKNAHGAHVAVAIICIGITFALAYFGGFSIQQSYYEMLQGHMANSIYLIPASALCFYLSYRMIKFVIKDVFVKTM